MTRTILITGCSSGIGLATARMMRGRGWRVFASCRRAEDCASLAAEGFEAPLLDHADETSIEAALAEVLAATGGRLDAVYVNGAYALPGAVADVPRAALREIFEANVFGVHDLVRRVLPVMLGQGHGRIVLCSSVLGIAGMRYRGPYVATKFAMEGLYDTLRLELMDLPGAKDIHVSLVEPGPIDTPIRVKSIPHFEKWIGWEGSAWRAVYEAQVIPRLRAPMPQKRGPVDLPPEAVARRVVHACEAARPKPRYFVTVATWGVEALRRLLTTRARDRLLRKG
ncbi:SDR family NAD(P)-dependent oxidoreductase [Rhodovulum sp. DZ06]|uniref:SDR family NAD(P)-dependent oxidoreductase n=1 Tax=Rhodovulum sp. DZ06 TaxID=3425126 RepID=UPI003D346E97